MRKTFSQTEDVVHGELQQQRVPVKIIYAELWILNTLFGYYDDRSRALNSILSFAHGIPPAVHELNLKGKSFSRSFSFRFFFLKILIYIYMYKINIQIKTYTCVHDCEKRIWKFAHTTLYNFDGRFETAEAVIYQLFTQASPIVCRY